MWKSGLIVGVVALLFGLVLSISISPLCPLCLAILLGLAAGYLSCVFDKPVEQNQAMKSGALAGAISGIGAILGQAGGAAINGALIGPEKMATLLRQLGLPGSSDPQFYWAGLVGGTCCSGLADIAILAVFGLIGGVVWWSMAGKKHAGVA